MMTPQDIQGQQDQTMGMPLSPGLARTLGLKQGLVHQQGVDPFDLRAAE